MAPWLCGVRFILSPAKLCETLTKKSIGQLHPPDHSRALGVKSMIHDPVEASTHRKASCRMLAVALAILLGVAVAAPARAQNLVTDPNFIKGFNAYTNVCCNVTTMLVGDSRVAVLPGGSTFSQVIATSSVTSYLVSFVASFTGPGTYTASFGNTVFHEDPTLPGTFSFVAPGLDTSSTLTFSTTGDSSTEYLSNLDVEAQPAPLPAPGAGILSFGMLLAGLAARRLRSRLKPKIAC